MSLSTALLTLPSIVCTLSLSHPGILLLYPSSFFPHPSGGASPTTTSSSTALPSDPPYLSSSAALELLHQGLRGCACGARLEAEERQRLTGAAVH